MGETLHFNHKEWWLVALIAAIALALVAGGNRWAQSSATAEARDIAAARAAANAGLLDSELQKYRLLPLVLAEHPDVHSVLQRGTEAGIARVNGKLELLAERTDAAVIYLIDREGRTIAASNWRLPTSFVGHNYGFRPYFSRALAQGSAEHFALGTVSRRPGLFIARRVGAGLGVIVVKVEFEHLEQSWARQTGATIVRNQDGVVTIASRSDWRLRTTGAIEPATAERLRRSLQFGKEKLQPLPFALAAPYRDRETITTQDGKRYAAATTGVASPGWSLSSLEPLEPALAAARAKERVTLLGLAILLLVAFGLWFRIRERRQLGIAAKLALEEEVRVRTAELRGANEKLIVESAERERSDRRFRAAREELAQANRLASLGQITAGVAHEINQPVAAIRTFAESAATLLRRNDLSGTGENLGTIVQLTERIGNITRELRRFARREVPPAGPVALSQAIDGALLLLGDPIRSRGVTLIRNDRESNFTVVADHIRLEQVLINLLQNALDALANVADPSIAITVSAEDKAITVTVADNGPGVSLEIRNSLFTPFVTGKPQGLGLGLGIALDIVRDFGGELSLAKSPFGGAAFAIRLLRP